MCANVETRDELVNGNVASPTSLGSELYRGRGITTCVASAASATTSAMCGLEGARCHTDGAPSGQAYHAMPPGYPTHEMRAKFGTIC